MAPSETRKLILKITALSLFVLSPSHSSDSESVESASSQISGAESFSLSSKEDSS